MKNFLYGIYYFRKRCVNNTKNVFLSCLPMDKNSTPELEITGSLVEQALKRDKYPKPSATSLAFLKNFARNFKVHQSVEGDIRELVLN